jgi:hypothetical protein
LACSATKEYLTGIGRATIEAIIEAMAAKFINKAKLVGFILEGLLKPPG